MLKKLVFLACSMLLVACASKLAVVSENPANVTFQVKSVNNDAVLTFWRKIDSNGAKSGRFSIGVPTSTLVMNGAFPKYTPTMLKLDPGLYYLDSFQVPVDKGTYCLSEKGHFAMRNGWNDEKNMPYYVAFRVAEGQQLELPEIIFQSCTASIDDPKNILIKGSRLQLK